jgi:hypothetical protein
LKLAKADEPLTQFALGPIDVSYDTSTVQSPAPISTQQRRTLVNIFEESMPSTQSHMIVFQALFLEGNLSMIQAFIILHDSLFSGMNLLYASKIDVLLLRPRR